MKKGQIEEERKWPIWEKYDLITFNVMTKSWRSTNIIITHYATIAAPAAMSKSKYICMFRIEMEIKNGFKSNLHFAAKRRIATQRKFFAKNVKCKKCTRRRRMTQSLSEWMSYEEVNLVINRQCYHGFNMEYEIWIYYDIIHTFQLKVFTLHMDSLDPFCCAKHFRSLFSLFHPVAAHNIHYGFIVIN